MVSVSLVSSDLFNSADPEILPEIAGVPSFASSAAFIVVTEDFFLHLMEMRAFNSPPSSQPEMNASFNRQYVALLVKNQGPTYTIDLQKFLLIDRHG